MASNRRRSSSASTSVSAASAKRASSFFTSKYSLENGSRSDTGCCMAAPSTGLSLPRRVGRRHSPGMRTGADYRESLKDGRRVFVLGQGWVEDVATHPATCAMTEEYVTWYDRHFDPGWQDLVLTPPDS